MTHTLESLLSDTLARADCAPGDAVEISITPGVASAHALPPLAVRREARCGLAGSPYAVIEHIDVDIPAVMSTELGSGGETRKIAIRSAVQAKYNIGSGAETDRRIYEVAALLLGME
jgi:hypothetical protein